MPPLRIHQLVAQEFSAARDWYAERSPVAAENFVKRFDEAKSRVRLRPGSHAPWRGEFRRARLTPFPYLLIFHFGRQQIPVLALIHSHQEPDRTLSTVHVRLESLP